MKKKKVLLLSLIISGAQAAGLPLIGLDSGGRPIEVLVQRNVWDSKINKAIGALSESTLYSLDKQRATFSKVAIGTYVKMKLGLGPMKGTAEPYFKLYFSKK